MPRNKNFYQYYYSSIYFFRQFGTAFSIQSIFAVRSQMSVSRICLSAVKAACHNKANIAPLRTVFVYSVTKPVKYTILLIIYYYFKILFKYEYFHFWYLHLGATPLESFNQFYLLLTKENLTLFTQTLHYFVIAPFLLSLLFITNKCM